jgi:hypothetical protein
MSKNPNRNCLEGMKCVNPKCTDPYGPFDIQCTSVFTVYDDGADEHQDVEWDKDSWAMCQNCQTEATVGKLRESGANE